MLSSENAEIVKRHVIAETNHQMAETLATLTEDCRFDDRAFNRVWRGRPGAGAYYRMWWDAFAIKPETEARHAAAEDLLVVETRFTGTHQGAFLGVGPTGRTVSVPMCIFVTFRDGLLSGERFYWSLANLMEQIGADLPWTLDSLGTDHA